MGLCEGSGLLEAFLEHLVSPNAIQEVKLMKDAMEQRLGFYGYMREGWIGQSWCDLISAFPQEYLCVMLKATMPWKT
jgi:hypothetical protein